MSMRERRVGRRWDWRIIGILTALRNSGGLRPSEVKTDESRAKQWSSSMSKKNSGIHPALKHGVYSGTALLPGEDPGEFEKLRKRLIADVAPAGPLEEDIVANMARLMWRRQNLSTYRLAGLAKQRISVIHHELIPRNNYDPLSLDSRDPEEVKAAEKAADEKARKELGRFLELAKLGEVATIDYLQNELSLIDRLDSMIDRCVKRLLMVRGLKSLSSSTSTAPSEPKRIAAARP
jgi:hypothetical protein